MYRNEVICEIVAPDIDRPCGDDVRDCADRMPENRGYRPCRNPEPGDTFPFHATITGAVPPTLAYRWSVSTGKIVKGQGTDKIEVEAEWETSGISIAATVEIFGFPKDCPSTGSETAGVAVDYFDPILVDEFSSPVGRIENARVIAYAAEMKKYPNSFAYILEYFRPGTRQAAIDKKLAKTRLVLTKAGLEPNSFRIEVTRGTDSNFTRLFRVPPGANNPTP